MTTSRSPRRGDNIPTVADYAHWGEEAHAVWYAENRYDMEHADEELSDGSDDDRNFDDEDEDESESKEDTITKIEWILVDQINDQVFGPFATEEEAKVYVVDFEWGTNGWVILPLMHPEEVPS